MPISKVLKVNSDAELLSYIINANPELSSEIDLPVQGQSLAPIGKIIVSNERFKNAFINTINLIGLTVIDRNYWENPWKGFTDRGTLRFGQTVRELFVEMAKVFDYQATVNNPTNFLTNVVPDVFNYLHELNFQKYYKTTTSDEEIAMAFSEEGGLMRLIEQIVQSLYKGYSYDMYIVSKYMLCRRILDGTVTSIEIDNYGSLTNRQRVSFIKNVSSKMKFLSPNYNPAGVHNSSDFNDQILIMNTDFEADYDTDVLATSYFMDRAQFKTNYALIDGFNNHDTARLLEVLGSQYVPFTEGELTALAAIPCVIVDREWFQIYTYSLDNASDPAGDGTRKTSFFNPETLRNNHWLHAWKVFSTSPFMQAVVFTKDVAPAVSAIDVSPATADVSAGQNVQMTAAVTTTGFANKSVLWEITADSETDPEKQATINQNGLVKIPAGHAKYNAGTQGDYRMAISTALVTSESITIDGITYTADASDDTAAKQASAIAALFSGSVKYTVSVVSSTTVKFLEKSGKYGEGAPTYDDSAMTTGKVTWSTQTEGVATNTGQIVVKATSVFNKTTNDTATLTVK